MPTRYCNYSFFRLETNRAIGFKYFLKNINENVNFLYKKYFHTKISCEKYHAKISLTKISYKTITQKPIMQNYHVKKKIFIQKITYKKYLTFSSIIISLSISMRVSVGPRRPRTFTIGYKKKHFQYIFLQKKLSYYCVCSYRYIWRCIYHWLWFIHIRHVCIVWFWCIDCLWFLLKQN